MVPPVIDIEKLFQALDESANILKEELHLSYLDALAESGENLFQNAVLQEVHSFTEKRLLKKYEEIHLNQFSNEQIRKAFQLAILKGMKEAVQPNHEMTPDAVCLFISYLFEKLTVSKPSLRLLDPAYGTGNLVTAILNHTNKAIRAYGVEVDETLIKLGFVGSNLQKHEVELFKQDALQPIFVDDVDVIVSDLPVGYYPNDIVAKDYELHTTTMDHSFIHYLYIEKAIRHLKEGGYFIGMIPNFMFTGEEAKNLNNFIKQNAIIIGLLQLPLSMFKNEKHAKSIFILQKKGDEAQIPKQALLVDLPSFSNKQAMSGMIQRIDSWFKTNIYK